ncbi:MAG: hypothetical protein ABJK11_12570 [Balneola sp.]
MANRKFLYLNIFFIIVIYMVTLYLSNILVFNEEFYLKSFSDQVPEFSILAYLDYKSNFDVVNYFMLILSLILKTVLTSICISLGLLMAIGDVSFRKVFKSVIYSEWVFVLSQIAYLIILVLNSETLVISNVSNYYPLSIISFFGSIEKDLVWLIYPLKSLNIFEVLFTFSFSFFYSRFTNLNYEKTLGVTFVSYFLWLFLWLAFTIFLTILTN